MRRFPCPPLLLALALLLAGCNEAAPPAPPASPALWQVAAPDGSEGWLFGTIHALPDGYAWRTPAIDSALGRAGVLVVEVEGLGDGHSGPRAFAAVSQSAGLPPLLSRVAPEDRRGLQAAIDRAGMKEGDFAVIETWAAALMLANGAGASDSDNGVDRVLLSSGKPVIPLESFEAQFAMFDRLAEEDQRVILTELARETAAGTAEAEERELARAWIEGDLARLEEEDRTGLLADPELRSALLVERNRAWAAAVAPLLRQGRRPFVAVGAQHMVGPDGLPAMLQAQGFTVQRLR